MDQKLNQFERPITQTHVSVSC